MEGIVKSLLSGAINVLELVQLLSGNNERFLSVVNGVIGDTLVVKKSPLAIPMRLMGKARGSSF